MIEVTSESDSTAQQTRVTALDGLRGLAALIVVLHHGILASDAGLAAQYSSHARRPSEWSLNWWLADTPLHFLWAGQEMVVVFFVLSGYVLAIPAIRKGSHWLGVSYYPRRMLRLYLPVWGALCLAIALHAAYSRVMVRGSTFWLNDHAISMTARSALRMASILRQQQSFAYTSVLWSLSYEVAFSVILPIALLFGVYTARRPRLAGALAVGCLVMCGTGAALGIGILRFLPMFELGVLIAFHARRSGTVFSTVPRWLLLTAGIAGVTVLIDASYELSNTGVTAAPPLPTVLVLIGAALAVWLCATVPPVSSLFDTRTMQWLGTRSFSLYLVHEPIEVTLAFMLGGRPNPLLLLALSVPCSLAISDLFWRFVERPTIDVARWSGLLVNRLTDVRLPSPAVTSEQRIRL